LPHCRSNVDGASWWLRDAGIGYQHMKALGGLRHPRKDSPNMGWRNESFRGYADYMQTDQFNESITRLLALASESRTAYMCAERVYFHCHRMLVSDWLVARGHEVLHIDSEGPPRPHHLTAEATMVGNQLLYRGDRLF
jgi:uncharacterized protein (DUF488 family)